MKEPCEVSLDGFAEAMLALRDTDEEVGTDWREAGPCWCAGWVQTAKVGHSQECQRARELVLSWRELRGIK